MAKLPYMQFYPADYQADVRCLSLAAQGAWMNILCTLWRSPKRGHRTLSLEGWANEIGRPSSEIKLLLIEMDNCGICDMNREHDEQITIKCRRMLRDERVRRLAAARQQKQRDKSESRIESRDRHSDVTGIYQKSDIRYQNQISEVIKEKKGERKKKSSGQVNTLPGIPKSALVWKAYSEAYQGRYGIEPVRNRQTNSLLCLLVDKLGEQEAPLVASFYLSHNNPFYMAKRHPPNLLLQDAEGLRTQWATGVKYTTSEAKHAEFKDNLMGKIARVEQILSERRQA